MQILNAWQTQKSLIHLKLIVAFVRYSSSISGIFPEDP